jgi:hypothetical protein
MKTEEERQLQLERIQAWLDTSKETPRWKELSSYCKEWSDNFRRLLERFSGIDGPMSWPQLWKAAKSVGFSRDEFSRLNLGELYEVLRAKAMALDESRARSALLPDGSVEGCGDALQKATGSKGGRRAGTPVNGKLLRKFRGDLSQDALAEASNVSIYDIQRGEDGRSWPKLKFNRVANGLNSIGRLEFPVTAEMLKKTS